MKITQAHFENFRQSRLLYDSSLIDTISQRYTWDDIKRESIGMPEECLKYPFHLIGTPAEMTAEFFQRLIGHDVDVKRLVEILRREIRIPVCNQILKSFS